MRAQKVLDHGARSFGPEMMKLIGQAFDEAWASIAGNIPGYSAQTARLRLATIILSLATDATDESRDAESLKAAALKIMSRDDDRYEG